MSYKSEQEEIRKRLESDIVKYLASGKKIDVRPMGESVQVDATNEWPQGFSREDNLKFGIKRPRDVQL